MFKEEPSKFEPTYGGWCAWGMKNGRKIGVKDPRIHVLNGSRLHVFFNERAKRNFEKDLDSNEQSAGSHWKDFSEEAPRI